LHEFQFSREMPKGDNRGKNYGSNANDYYKETFELKSSDRLGGGQAKNSESMREARLRALKGGESGHI